MNATFFYETVNYLDRCLLYNKEGSLKFAVSQAVGVNANAGPIALYQVCISGLLAVRRSRIAVTRSRAAVSSVSIWMGDSHKAVCCTVTSFMLKGYFPDSVALGQT